MASFRMIPRSFWYLVGAVVLVGGWLLLGTGDEGAESTLIAIPAPEITRIVVRDAESTYALSRGADGWRLDGDTADHLDDDDVQSLIDDLAAAPRSYEPVAEFDAAAGSQYGLTDVRALHLAVEGGGGASAAFTIGGVNDVTGTAYVLNDGDGRVFMTTGEVRSWLAGVPNAVRADEVWPGFEESDADTLELRLDGGVHLFARDGLRRWWPRDDGRVHTGPAADYLRRHDDRSFSAGGARWLRADNRTLRNLVSALADAAVSVFHRPGRRAQPAPVDGLGIRAASRGGAAHDLVLGDVNGLNIDAWRDGCGSGLVTAVDLLTSAQEVLASPLRGEVLTHGLALADSFRLDLSGWPPLTVAAGAGAWVPLRTPNSGRPFRNQVQDMAVLLDRLAMTRVLEPRSAPEDVFGQSYRLTLRTWQSDPGLPAEQVMVFGISKAGDRILGWRPADGFVCEVPRDVMTSARALVSGSR